MTEATIDPVLAAAIWLADHAVSPQPVIPIIREKFELSAHQACEACRRADEMRMVRRAFG